VLVQGETSIERVEPMAGMRDLAQAVRDLKGRGHRLATELDVAAAALVGRLRSAMPSEELVDVSPLVLAQRGIKDETEVAAIARAAKVADVGHREAREAIRAGRTELDVAARVEYALRAAGHEAIVPVRTLDERGCGVLLMSRDNLRVRGGFGLVMTGRGLGPSMPFGPGRRAIERGDLVMVDIGVTVGGYTADEARTYVVGRPNGVQQALVDLGWRTAEAVIEASRPGRSVRSLFQVGQAVVRAGRPPLIAPGEVTLTGFVGHGVGVEIDEPPVLWPRAEGEIEEGMTLSIEIELLAEEHALAAKVEDTIVVTGDGGQRLTDAPRGLPVCGEGYGETREAG
jgi:Xaa-Pro aminopeptidase